MSASPFTAVPVKPAPPTKPKMTRVLPCLLRKATPDGMERAQVLFVEGNSESYAFNQINLMFMRKSFSAGEWTELFDLVWRELGVHEVPNAKGPCCPHITLTEFKDRFIPDGLYLTMVYRPITIPTEFLEPFCVILDGILNNRPEAEIITSITVGTRTEMDALQIYNSLKLHLPELLCIEPVVPFDRTEESFLKK